MDKNAGDISDRHDLSFDPIRMDIVCRRGGTRPGGCQFNIPHRHIHHSPTGMEWGYDGLGPADFSLNVLALFLPLSAHAECVALNDGSQVSAVAWQYYQAFMHDHIAGIPEAGGMIPGHVIRRWLREHGAMPTT